MSEPAHFAQIRKMPCTACGDRPSDVAHIRSRGSGGNDSEENVMPLCRKHHVLQHSMNWHAFAANYWMVDIALHQRGWRFDGYKLVHDNPSTVMRGKKNGTGTEHG